MATSSNTVKRYLRKWKAQTPKEKLLYFQEQAKEGKREWSNIYKQRPFYSKMILCLGGSIRGFRDMYVTLQNGSKPFIRWLMGNISLWKQHLSWSKAKDKLSYCSLYGISSF